MEFHRLDYYVVNNSYSKYKHAKTEHKLCMRFHQMCDLTHHKRLNLEPDTMVSEIEIRCHDGSFMFRPSLILFSHSITGSLFNTTIMKYIEFEYDIKTVKSLFSIFLSDWLPDELEEYVIAYLEMCDYLCFDFYTKYFSNMLK